MRSTYHINVQYRTNERRLLHAFLAILTGVLTLVYPDFLYLIAAGYLLALGTIMIIYKIPAFIAAFPIVTGVVIFLFPELIPYTFAAFLGFFGVILLMAFQFTVIGFLTLIIAILIFMNPDSVAYLIAVFLMLYGASDLIRYYRERHIHPTTLQ